MNLSTTRPPRRADFPCAPGITGIWQVSDRSDIRDFDEVVKLDMLYIDNWSLGLDIKIMLKTVGAVLGRKGSK